MYGYQMSATVYSVYVAGSIKKRNLKKKDINHLLSHRYDILRCRSVYRFSSEGLQVDPTANP